MKVLIVRLSSIGDVVLTTPIVRCLKQQQQEVEIHYVTKKSFFPVLQSNPYIDKIHVVEHRVEEIIPALKKESFSHVVDLHKNLRSFRLKSTLRVPSTTFDKINIRKWLMVNFKIDRLPNHHIVDRYFEAVRSLGVQNDGSGLDYFVPESDRISVAHLPGSFSSGYIAWAIGGNHKTKIFPREKIVEVLDKITMPVVLLGGPADEEAGQFIANFHSDRVFNACGKFNINQSASLIQSAELVLTNDTGLMHIAAAFQKKILSFWGNTIPGFGMTPYMPGLEARSSIMEVNGLACRPCSKLGYARCPKKHFKCMNEIQTGEIVAQIERARASA